MLENLTSLENLSDFEWDSKQAFAALYILFNTFCLYIFCIAWNFNLENEINMVHYPILKIYHSFSKLISITILVYAINYCILLTSIFLFSLRDNIIVRTWFYSTFILMGIILLQGSILPDIFAFFTFLLAIQKLILMKFPKFQNCVMFKNRLFTWTMVLFISFILVTKIAVPIICKFSRYKRSTPCVLEDANFNFLFTCFLSFASILIHVFLLLFPKSSSTNNTKPSRIVESQAVLLFLSKSIMFWAIVTNDGLNVQLSIHLHTVAELLVMPPIINLTYIILNRRKLGLRSYLRKFTNTVNPVILEHPLP
ncbi:hypothetical protein CAEBREN_04688 [Caenorhabditis brenneri]|uniref:Uncharacterized protein n=1 Tax=Caenorhabditis brenneri TaxID=135651 RepID=G0NHP5_CAEBE|nr:hypothetical protein CAEBREN_04688 [Caenorhabditis brenneri]